MKRVLRYALWGFGGIATLALLAAITGFFVVQTEWFRNKVRDRIVYETERATGGRVELREFRFDWHTLTAEVRGFTIHGRESAKEEPLFRAESIRVGLKIISVLRKKVDLASVAVRKPQVNVIVYEDGTTNLPKPKVPRTSKRSTLDTVLDLAIKRFDLTDGVVQAQLRRLPLNAHGENLRALVFYDAAPARYRGEIAFRSLDVRPGGMKPLPLDIDARMTLERDRLQIASVKVAGGGATLSVSGTLDHFRSPEADFRYALRAELKQLTPEVKLGPFERRGAVSFEGHATWKDASPFAVTGKLAATGLAFREAGIAVDNIRVDSAVNAGPDRIEFKDLRVHAMHGRFDGHGEIVKLAAFHMEGDLRGFALQDAARVKGVQHMMWTGSVSGPLALKGEVRAGKLASLRLNTALAIAPAPGDNPVSGEVRLSYDHAARELLFEPSHVQTQFSTIQFSGVLGHELKASAETTNINDAEPAVAIFRAEPMPALPVSLIENGIARFHGTVTGPLKNPVIQGHAVAEHFIVIDREFDRAEADVVVTQTGLAAQNASVARLGVRATGSASASMHAWKLDREQTLAGSFAVHAPALADVITTAKVKAPAGVSSGPVAANVALGGTIGAPEVKAHLQVSRALLWDQPVDRIEGDARFTETSLEFTSGVIESAGGRAQGSAHITHSGNDWSHGKVRYQVSSNGLALAQLHAVREHVPGIEGRLDAQANGEFGWEPAGFQPGPLTGHVAVQALAVNGEALGALQLAAETQASTVHMRLTGELAGSHVNGTSTCSLEGTYATRGHIEFTPLRFSTLLARFGGTRGAAQPPFTGSASGTFDFSGNARDEKTWKGLMQLPSVEVEPSESFTGVPNTNGLVLRNSGSVMVDFDRNGARVRQARFHGKNTDLSVGGRVGFGTRNPWDLRVQGNVNLALLRDFNNDVLSSGAMALDVSVRGALAKPDVYGRIDLKKASFNLANFPNGIDNANGVVFLYRDRAMIETLTAESGGGKIAVTGFVSFANVTTFHLQAKATDVRVRYPEGVSSTSNATLTYTGTTDRSVLSGDVTIMRVGFNPRSDLGTILANAAAPIEVPAQPSRFRQGLRFDVRIVTSPQVQFETKLTKDIQADANMRLRGNATHPVVLGRVIINQGDVMFFGNKYSINAGQIVFVNAAKIEPTVSLDLETKARGIDVTLHVSGPVNKLNVSYRSDPPLSFADIVALLTTGREPGLTPGVSGSQSQVGQNWQQAGASALVTQAIASPIAGRLQRFFGVSRLKIDPQITGLTTSNAAARLTLEQNVTPKLTFTYITDLSRAQAQTVRIEFDFTRNWSGVAVREENGIFGIDFLYRKQVK